MTMTNAEVGKAIRDLDASNQGVVGALKFTSDLLTTLQEFLRNVGKALLVAFALILLVLIGLGVNAWQAGQQRGVLTRDSLTQLRTLNLLTDSLSPGRQAEQAAATQAAIIQIQCNDRQAIVDSFRAINPQLHVHLPGTPGVPARAAVPSSTAAPGGIPAIPAIPGCPAINVTPTERATP